jgi:nuclear protein localization family protein 4
VETIRPFYTSWVKKGTDKQRAAILFGKYIPEPAETKNEGAIRALVHSLYEPPQEAQASGVRFLRDPDEKTVHEVAERLGLEPVGWVITTLPRSGEKYGGKVFLSGAEVLQAARFQNRYKNELGQSRFVTVVIEHGETVEPKAYQVSDQCVAMERDGLIVKAEDPFMLGTREQKKGEMPPAIVYKNKSILPGIALLPDDFLVKVIVSEAKNPEVVFQHNIFPSRGSDIHMRSHMAEYTRQPYEQKLADFNLLVYLAKTIGWPLTQEICDSIRDKKGLSKDQREALDRALVAKNLL